MEISDKSRFVGDEEFYSKQEIEMLKEQ